MTVYIIDIEAVDTRYTKQWKQHLPVQLEKYANSVVVISGGDTPQATTPGAFLNFGGTNVYKSKQLETIGEMFCNGEIKDGDIRGNSKKGNHKKVEIDTGGKREDNESA